MNDFIVWLKGLMAAIISGAAHSIAAMIIDPAKFNFSTGLKPIGEMALVSGIIGACLYLQRSPIPGYETK